MKGMYYLAREKKFFLVILYHGETLKDTLKKMQSSFLELIT